ncbi:MAG: DMT family transporter [Planctomycetota bacterium]|jgi:drug/metabolite transporter (DMT)-like permease
MSLPSKPTLALIITVICSFLGAFGQAFFKLGSETVRPTSPGTWLMNWKLVIGLGFYGIATVLFVYALSIGKNLSALYPAIALSYVWVFLISVFYFHEKIAVVNWVGVGFIIVGVALTAGMRAA